MITVNINSTDRTSLIIWNSLSVDQNLTSLVDNASFSIRKMDGNFTPDINDEVEIFDGSDKIFGGKIINIQESVESGGGGLLFSIQCVDYSYDLDGVLVAETYESMTIEDIIDSIITDYAPAGFTTTNVECTFEISKVVFNQVPITTCLKRLADLVKYEWYIDPDKDIHFFAKESLNAPFDLTDDSGNYVYKSLLRTIDGTQVANQVKVRGGLATETNLYTDVITVSGNESLSVKLPFKFANLAVRLDTGGGYVAQTVGAMFLNTFDEGYDVLYSYQDDSIQWETALSDGDLVEFSGYKKYPVMAIATDDVSVAEYGLREKLIKDTSIEDQTLARKRAIAELEVYKDEISDAKFRTYTSGLRAGMIIGLTSTLRDTDTVFLIKKLTMKPVDPNTFIYNADVVTTKKYDLVELLQKLMEVEDDKIDPNEVAEVIKTDIVTVSISELIEAIAAIEDLATIIITEDIEKDPLGAGVAPEWVLAPYIPSPWPTDPKREGRLDISMELY